MMDIAQFEAEWEAALDVEDRYRALIALGEALPPMDPALKTPATKVPGCSASVWVYPLLEGGRLRFQADSDAAITKGIVALIVALADGRTPEEVLATDFEAVIARLGLRQHLSSNRTQGIPNMIARVREAARRLAA
ncbi:MAG: SufE family protein [Sphingomonadaceae bacterium]|uniref:SufE family protein n=1 Tax=Thermaurantiacus sp. TaxID=2820283 RepID=UPI00298F0BC1|nr:SufE family protein [Thermaurantiacus sp.]MCS6985908.1 SufE family protein [Sphingomonadaceae bacterium]MDW8414876.1 SufE family protein [Thermaurantiacus sp.]